MSTSKATARPWIADSYYTDGKRVEIRMNGVRIARMLPASAKSPSEAEQTANAALIVRAVNSHEALVAALRGMLQHAGWAASEKARAALALAEQGG